VKQKRAGLDLERTGAPKFARARSAQAGHSIDGKVKLCVIGMSIMVDF
jgi:hypothetical protein